MKVGARLGLSLLAAWAWLLASFASALAAHAATIPGSCVVESEQARGKPLGRVSCQVGDLAVGARGTATVVLRPSAAGTLGTTARAKQAPVKDVDPNPANDAATSTSTFGP